jgi:hypothetical protein
MSSLSWNSRVECNIVREVASKNSRLGRVQERHCFIIELEMIFDELRRGEGEPLDIVMSTLKSVFIIRECTYLSQADIFEFIYDIEKPEINHVAQHSDRKDPPDLKISRKRRVVFPVFST